MFPEELRMTDHKEEEIFEMKKGYPYVIRKIAVSWGRTVLVPWHWHQELEFIILKKGLLEYRTPDKKVTLRAGDGVFVNGSILHQILIPDPASEIEYEVHMFLKEFVAPAKSRIDQKYISPLLNCNQITVLLLQRDKPVYARILDELKQLSRMGETQGFGYEVQSRNMVSQILLELIQDQNEAISQMQTQSYCSESRLKIMLLFMQEHYMENISLKDISESAHIGERECLRCFQKLLHVTPIAYLQSYRIQVACGLLCYTTDNVIAIAMKTGFSSSSYFGKTFCKHIGCTPQEYRKKHGW